MWADSNVTFNLRSLLVAYLDDMFKLFNGAGQSKGCDFFSRLSAFCKTEGNSSER